MEVAREPRLGRYLRNQVLKLAWWQRHVRREQHVSAAPDTGTTLLRTVGEEFPEIWCRCDGGLDGCPGVAAHAHADALSLEIRYAGVGILTNPGTCCHHAGPAWRSHSGSAAGAREIEAIDDGDIASWTAEREGYAWLHPSALHRRSVLLDRASRSIDIIDVIDDGGGHTIRLAFYLGPDIQAELQGSRAVLNWPTASAPGAARLELPLGLRWSLHGDQADPNLGRRVLAGTLRGRGRCLPGMPLITRLEFVDVGKPAKSAVSRQAVSWTTSVAPADEAPEIRAEAR